jgi:hypothetical protein
MPGPNKIFLDNRGGTTRFLGRQYEGGQLTHFRGFREDLRPHKQRVEEIAKGARESKHGMQYIGSVPRVVIHDWLMKQGKNWQDYATDRDLKAKFMAWFKSEYKLLTNAGHNERSLAINRSQSGRLVSAPKLGAQILGNYQKEMAT